MRRNRFILFIALVMIGLGAWFLYNRTIEPVILPTPEPVTITPAPVTITGTVDRILIEKQARRLTVYQNQIPVKTYDIGLGFAPLGDKVKEGDGKTPEGVYKINRRNAQSSFTLSLGIDYPLAKDLERARIGGYSAGGDIFIHGQPNSLSDRLKIRGDWTAGCIALSNAEIRELWAAAPMGTEVEIRP